MIPLCLQCFLEEKTKKAKRLPVQPEDGDHIFCSLTCAARYALNHHEDLYQWCEDHGWYYEEPNGICPKCPVDDME